MAKEIFPRLRDKSFDFIDVTTVPSYQTGRLDLVCSEKYSEPRTYKVLAAANGIVDTMSTRPGIRPADEALRNELVLRGVPDNEMDQVTEQIKNTRVMGEYDWKGYLNVNDGNITDVFSDRTLVVPSPESAVKWFERYDTLQEEDEE